MDDKTAKAIEKRLDAILLLLLTQRATEDSSFNLKAQIGLLSSVGFQPIEISHVLGKTQSHVNKELAHLRKSRKKA